MATESNRGQPHKSEDGSGALELLWKQCPQAILKQVVPGRHIHRNIVLMTKTFFVLEVEAWETILNPCLDPHKYPSTHYMQTSA